MRSTIIKFLPLSKNDLERKFGAQQMWQTKAFYQGNWLLEAWKAVPLPLSMHVYITFMLQRERDLKQELDLYPATLSLFSVCMFVLACKS